MKKDFASLKDDFQNPLGGNRKGFSYPQDSTDDPYHKPAIYWPLIQPGRLAQLAERLPYKEEVTGSSPVPPTMKVPYIQLFAGIGRAGCFG